MKKKTTAILACGIATILFMSSCGNITGEIGLPGEDEKTNVALESEKKDTVGISDVQDEVTADNTSDETTQEPAQEAPKNKVVIELPPQEFAVQEKFVPEEEPKPEETVTEEPKKEEPKKEEPKDESKQEPEAEKTVEPVNEADFLLLVNPWNMLPDDFKPNLVTLKGGHKVDERVYPDLQQMMDDMRAEGLSPYICSSYRTYDYQKGLLDKRIKNYMAKGMTKEEAESEATKWTAVPGTSEHHTGYALDIVAADHVVLDESQEKEPEQQWLMKNSWKYGFILRYPNGKTHITGIYYEPWHYRYVGKTAAKEIYESGKTLEEYLGRVNG